jgi:hypothetical protein
MKQTVDVNEIRQLTIADTEVNEIRILNEDEISCVSGGINTANTKLSAEEPTRPLWPAYWMQFIIA